MEKKIQQRRSMSKRIAILGPESAGKTTLTISLARALDASYSEEFAREYLQNSKGKYALSDLDQIAFRQFEVNQSTSKNDFFIADTEMITMKIWSLEVFDTVSVAISELLERQYFDLYLLCFPDLPWVYDPLRENENDRERLFDRYVNELQSMNCPFAIIKGEKRLEEALKIVNRIF